MSSGGYREVNRKAWDALASLGTDSSQPWGPEQFGDPRSWLDPEGWMPWADINTVLCLASGGGQQAPLFASLGYAVTVVDLSQEQLRRDRSVADNHGLSLECIEGDMLDLAFLRPRKFDLVFQAVSACYVPDVPALYREVAAVLAPRGWYHVEHWTPLHLQLAEESAWDGAAYRLVRPQVAGARVPWTSWDTLNNRAVTCAHYMHPLSLLLGALCDAGFVIHRYGERSTGGAADAPGSHGHLAQFLPPFLKVLARRQQ